MDRCDSRARAYRNGKTFDECREIAKVLNVELQGQIRAQGRVLWKDILAKTGHDELVYKLTLKYLRQDNFDIGDYRTPEVRPPG